MASTYSNLKIQLMATGENSTTWGTVTNLNLGTAIEEAIVGSADVTFASANVTLTLVDSNSSQTARNVRLRCTGTTGGSTRNLVVPSIEKPYIIKNDCADSIVVKTTAGTGITVPAGKTMWVYSDGVDVVDVTTHLSSLTLGAPLPITQGGTGANTTSAARTALGATTLGANVFTLTNPSAVTFPRFNADNTVSALDAASFRTAIGVGTVTSVSGTGSTNGLSLSGTVTSSGSITLSGSVTSVATGATIDGVVIGYRNIPRSTTSSTATTGDVGKCIAVTAGITIPNATFSAGDAISIYNDSASAVTITQGASLTLRQAGTTNTGNRTLAARGMATVWFNSSSEAIISGAGVS